MAGYSGRERECGRLLSVIPANVAIRTVPVRHPAWRVPVHHEAPLQ